MQILKHIRLQKNPTKNPKKPKTLDEKEIFRTISSFSIQRNDTGSWRDKDSVMTACCHRIFLISFYWERREEGQLLTSQQKERVPAPHPISSVWTLRGALDIRAIFHVWLVSPGLPATPSHYFPARNRSGRTIPTGWCHCKSQHIKWISTTERAVEEAIVFQFFQHLLPAGLG